MAAASRRRLRKITELNTLFLNYILLPLGLPEKQSQYTHTQHNTQYPSASHPHKTLKKLSGRKVTLDCNLYVYHKFYYLF